MIPLVHMDNVSHYINIISSYRNHMYANYELAMFALVADDRHSAWNLGRMFSMTDYYPEERYNQP